MEQQHAETDDEHHGDSNNNSFNSPQDKYQSHKNNEFSPNNSFGHNRFNSYGTDDYRQDQYGGNEIGYEGGSSPYSREDNSDYYSRANNSGLYSGGDVDLYPRDDNIGRPRYLDNMYSSTSYADRPNFKI